ncbi:MAG: peptidoglycan-binding protein [Clostridiales bacterium]|nr:peptidoglycan-binding protein [Clostridiales bacterium]
MNITVTQRPPEPLLPVIPETITVHLGQPGQSAENVEVAFPDYIKNVASSEIYPTWPEEALRANILAQISFALNRVYSEWYRSRGYDFDITSSTQFDQAYVDGRDVFENIGDLVDEIFNDYLTREGQVNPLFAQFCNGTTVTCAGLSQWGSVTLANQGYDAMGILRHYYGDDIRLVENAPVQNVEESFSGIPLSLGSSGNDVYTVQMELNRIRRNFPAIPLIPDVDGIFDNYTEEAVRAFQRAFNMPVTGVVDKAVWYRMKEIYTSVKRLADLSGEGIKISEVTPLYPTVLTVGDTGISVTTVQYYLNVFAYFNPYIPLVPIDGIYSQETAEAVMSFQQQYGLTASGVTDRATWLKMLEVYRGILSLTETEYSDRKAEIYPGYVLTEGMEGGDVENLQRYLVSISERDSSIPATEVTGYFGPRTVDAVRAIQRKYGIPESGNVGPLTWNTITYAYKDPYGMLLEAGRL